jgi:hypothetical protein
MQNSLGALVYSRRCATIRHMQNTAAGLPPPVQVYPYISPIDAADSASAGSVAEAPNPPPVAHHDDGSSLVPLVASPSDRGADLSSMSAPATGIDMSQVASALLPRAENSAQL